MTYGEAVMRIREIVDEIERGDLDVDLLSDRVKEAMRLSRLCNDKLLKIDGDVRKAFEEMLPKQIEEEAE